MIEVKNVVKTFDGFAALNDATLSVPTGAVYGLVGPNGAGKSTIIRHLAGIYRQDSGEVLLDGQPVYENPAVKRRMTVIGDDWYYFPQANIREMARFFAGLYPAFSWERYEKLKQVFPLDEKMMLRRMSKGMQKQAAFWLAVCCMPEYLILDEPVDGLDAVRSGYVEDYWTGATVDLTREQATELCRLAQQDANDVSDSDVLAAMAANSDDVYAAAAKEDTLPAETEAWDVYRYNIVIYAMVDGRDVSRSLTPMGYCTRMQSFIGSLDFTNTTTVDTEAVS